MIPFSTLESTVAPLLMDDVDTDQIIPARFLKGTDKSGLGENLFADWARLPGGENNPEFVLSRPRMAGAKILLARRNFGCGSSREHAPWALFERGFRAVVALSFADIFRSNALRNGLLPVQVREAFHARLAEVVALRPDTVVRIDLRSQTIEIEGAGEAFPIDGFSKHCLLQGVDELGYLLSLSGEITAHEARRA